MFPAKIVQTADAIVVQLVGIQARGKKQGIYANDSSEDDACVVK